jgi:hypothetical protein
MADLRIGNTTIHLGDQLDQAANRLKRTARSMALPALLSSTEHWLKFARVLLHDDHEAVQAMQRLVDELRQQPREKQL